MQNFGGQFKRGIKTVATMAASGAAFALLQTTAIGVSATILPVLVSVNHLDFGTVFPGEQLNREFTVTLAPENQSQTLAYWIEQKRKPLPPSHPEYPNGGDPGLPGFYRDLCPFLTKTPEAGEGDAEVQASLTAVTDPVDRWQVDLNVPAISSPIDGGVAQDHNGGVVSTNGEFGCDIGINVNPVCGNGIQEPGEECDLGGQNGLPGSHCSTQCKTVQDCTTPVDVVLVFDRSGSMKFDNGQRLIDAKVASKGFLDLLGANDHASLVSYSSSVTVNQTLSTDFALIKTKIDALTASGATNIGDAIKAANLELASSRARGDAIHVEVLLTDGKANKPFGSGSGENAADVAYAISKASEAATAGYKIFTIGLGSDINATMLQQIATSTGGQFFASPSSSDLAAIYAQISRALCPEVPRCGDGVKNQPSEQCDDGNGVNDDACQNNCTLPGTGGPETFCGDGVRQTPNDSGFNEQCDDKNQVNGDGCETDCTITTFCGDNSIQRPNDSFQIEACDNGPSNGVACTPAYGSQCTYCATSCEEVTVVGPRCGDGVKNGSEQCDDGNTVDNDTCRNNCTAFIAPFCGDGKVNQSSEECDDGSQNGQPGSQCSSSCLRTACSQPADVVLVFDRSGSMNFDNGQRLIDAKAAAKGFLDLLTPTDRAALIVYSSFIQTPQTLTANFAGIKTKIDAITATGATNIGDAIQAANLELTSVRARTSAAHVEILLTDGKANKPNGNGSGENAADVAYAIQRAQQAAGKGIRIFTIGLGSDINATMLQQIATITGGQYFASPSSTDLAAIYRQIAGDLCPDARCGDGSVNQATEQCDAGQANGTACTADYGSSCTYCSAICQNTRVVGPFCGDSQVNGTEACDDGNTNDADACRNDCTSAPLGLAAPPLCLGDHCGGQSGPNGISLIPARISGMLARL